MARVFTSRRSSDTPPIPGYRYFNAQPMTGTNPGMFGIFHPDDDTWYVMTGTSTGISNVNADNDWDATGTWAAACHSSFGNKINLFKYDSTTEQMTYPTPGASGPPNNWSSFKTQARFHPTTQLIVGVGEFATRLESASYVSGDIWTKSTGNFSVDYPSNVFCCGWNKEGTHLAVGGNSTSSTSSYVYTLSGTTFTKVTAPYDVQPGAGGPDVARGLAYNPIYPYLVFQVSTGGNGVHPAYKYSGTSYTQVSADVTSANTGTVGVSGGSPCIAWSPDGLYLYIGSNSAGTSPNIRAYSLNPATDVFTAVDVVEADRLITDGASLSISPDGKYLTTTALSSLGTPLFKRHSDGTLTFVKYLNGTGVGNDAPAGTGSTNGTAFSKSLYLPYGDKNFERFALKQSRGNASHIYHFNEASGSVLDNTASGAGPLNTFVGTPTYSAVGKRVSGSAMTFTGSQMAYRTGALFGAGQTQSGLFMIIKPNVIAGSQRTLVSQGITTDATQFAETFITSGGELGFRSSRAAGAGTYEKITSGLGLASGTWYAIAIRQDWSGVGSPRFWINGYEWLGTFTTSTTGASTSSDWFSQHGATCTRNGFGCRTTTTSTNFYSGDIDDLVIFGSPGPSNISNLDDYTIRMLTKYGLKIELSHTYASALLQYAPLHYNRLIDPSITAAKLWDNYRFTPPTPVTGGTWVGGANTVTPTLLDTDAPLTGQKSFSMVFNGTTQFVDLLAVDTAKPSTSETGSLSAWFKGIPATAGYIWADFNDTQQQGMGIRVDATGSVSWILRRSAGATNEVTLKTTNTFGSGWHHVMVVSDNVGNNKIYVDGVDEAYGTTIAGTALAKDWWADVTASATFRPTVGACRTGAATIVSPYAGRVAECALTNRPLKSAEVSSLYATRTR